MFAHAVPSFRTTLCLAAVALASTSLVLTGTAEAGPYNAHMRTSVAPLPDATSAKARHVMAVIDSLDVEQHWPAGVRVNWQTGDPDGHPESGEGKHTHCSAFVAAAAKQLGVYILRPPEHGQVLLANAQVDWLSGDGARGGWTALPDAGAAQDYANQGFLVVAAYQNRKSEKPGHVAIVRPGAKSPRQLQDEGPDITQAGATNYRDIDMRTGFEGHAHAFADNEILFFAHDVP